MSRSARSGPPVMLLGYSLFGIVPLFIKAAHRSGWDAPSTVFARFCIACVCIAVLVLIGGQMLKTANPKVLILRGLFGGAAVLCFFAAVQQTGAGTGTLLNYTHSVWANVLGVLVLGQKPVKGFWLFLALAVAGLWLVIDPNFEDFKWGEAIGLLSGVLAGAAILCIKELRKTDNAVTILASFSVIGLLCALPLMLYNRLKAGLGLLPHLFSCLHYLSNAADLPRIPHVSPATPMPPIDHAQRLARSWPGQPAETCDGIITGWLFVLALGLAAFAGQWLFTHAYKNTSVQLGTLLSLTVPVMAAVLGWLFLDETLSAKFVLGAFMILTACTLAGLKEPNYNR